jgi:hypothetical protein
MRDPQIRFSNPKQIKMGQVLKAQMNGSPVTEYTPWARSSGMAELGIEANTS